MAKIRKLTIIFDEDVAAFSLTTLFLDENRNVIMNVHSKDTRNKKEVTLAYSRMGNDFNIKEEDGKE